MNAARVTTIEIAQGRLSGLTANGIACFKGIPYAAPPVGSMRWQMPGPAPHWAGTRAANAPGFVCPQAPTQMETLLGNTLGEQSEDCLYLNVWTPACDSAKRPVMVWLHGGAFVIGAGSQGLYNGEHLAATDCVIVTLNYRLGAFGFLNLADATNGALPGTGSEGLADQIAALHWVKQNIAQFGGDADNITIFGESAGAMSVSALMTAPPAKGLFHKAIAQSGAAHIGYTREHSARVAHAFLGFMGLSKADAHKIAEADYGALIKAQITLLADCRDGHDPQKLGRMPLQPTIDGAVLPVQPITAIREGSAKDIPLLTGTNLEEWKLFTAMNPAMRFSSSKKFIARMQRMAGPENAEEMLRVYSEGSVFERINQVMTDKMFVIPATRMMEAQSAHASVHAYRCDWKAKLLGGIMGACHAVELGFVFGTFRERLAGRFFGKGPDAVALSAAMIESWTNFAKTGNPEGEATGAWPTYDTAARQTMIFGDGEPHLTSDPNAARRRAWDALPEKKLGP